MSAVFEGFVASVLQALAPMEPIEVPLAEAAGCASAEIIGTGPQAVPARTTLRGPHLAMAARAGMARIAVSPRPRVVIVPVGDGGQDDAAPDGDEATPNPAGLEDACTLLVATALRDDGALVFTAPHRDTGDGIALRGTVEDQLVRADLVVLLTASQAMAEACGVLQALGSVTVSDSGAEPLGVVAHGSVGPDATPVMAIAADADGTFVATEVLLRPVVRRLLDREALHSPLVRARLRGWIPGSGPARRFIPAVLGVEDGVYAVSPVPHADHDFASVARANALISSPPGAVSNDDGSTVDVVMVERAPA